MKDFVEDIVKSIENVMYASVNDMAFSMRDKLQSHIDTGNLITSISTGTEREGDKINAYIDITAENDGTWYPEFLEYGSGQHRVDGTGRQDPWRYKDIHGKWHTTTGSRPYPFIRPSVAEHISELNDKIGFALKDGVDEFFDDVRYKK